MTFARGQRSPIAEPVVSPFSALHSPYASSGQATSAPASATAPGTFLFYPWFFYEPYPVTCFWMINGATVGTDSFDLGVYQISDPSTGRLDLLRNIGLTLSAGSANTPVAVSTFRTAAAQLTSGSDSTDATSYTTASVTLKAGRLYLLSVTNSKAASPDAASSVATTGGAVTFTSEKTVSFNSVASPTQRLTMFRAVPTADVTATIVITFGATQTGACWSLSEFGSVDTTTNNGVVQSVSNTTDSGTSVTATLAAFGSASNSTYGATAKGSTGGITPGTGFVESADVNAATPAQSLETEWRVDNDTSVDQSWSGNTGAAVIGVEIKASTSPFIIPAGWTYLCYATTGGTMTQFSRALSLPWNRAWGLMRSTVATGGGCPTNITPVAVTGSTPVLLGGVANRSIV